MQKDKPKFESNHAYQQQHYSPEAYLDTRVARPEHFREVVRSITDEIEGSGDTRILVLGPNSGENDLLPLVEALEDQENGSYDIVAIDDQPAAIRQAVENLQDQGVGLEEDESDVKWTSDGESLSVTLLVEDIEVYPSEVFDKSYDIVLSFFVFNHLTNWQLCIKKLRGTLREGGRIFVTQYDDPITRGLEDNPKEGEEEDEILKTFYKYHRNRLNDIGVNYCSSVLGTRIDFLKDELCKSCNHNVHHEVEYEVCTSREKVKERLEKALHTPIFWGRGDENTSEMIPELVNEGAGEKCYSGTLTLHRFSKRDEILETEKNLWHKNFRRVRSIIDKEIKVYAEEEKNEPNKWYKLLLQSIIGYQALTRSTQFVTPLFWEVKSEEKIDIEIDAPPRTWKSLVNSRNASEAFRRYANHLLLIRGHDTEHGSEERYSLAEAIFSKSGTYINWVFTKTEGNFDCEVIKEGDIKFFVIKIPRKYCAEKNEIEIDQFRHNYEDFKRRSLNNFTVCDFGELLERSTKRDYWDTERFMRTALNGTSKESEEDLREERLREVLNDPVWDHLGDDGKDDLANTLAVRSHRFAYLTQLGTCVYITDKLYDKEDGGAAGSGGFLFCEKDINIDDLRDPSSFLYRRYEFLQDVVNSFSRKTVLPSATAEVVKASEWRRIMRMMKHNITTDFQCLKVTKSEEIKEELVSDIMNKVKFAEYIGSEEKIKEYLDKKEKRKSKRLPFKNILHSMIEKAKYICSERERIGALKTGVETENSILRKGIENIIRSDYCRGDYAETFPSISRLIFKDIILNAIKYADTTDPKVVISENVTGDRIRVKVRNNGTISEKYRKIINSKKPKIKEPNHLGIYIYRQFGEALGWNFDCPETREETEIIVEIPK